MEKMGALFELARSHSWRLGAKLAPRRKVGAYPFFKNTRLWSVVCTACVVFGLLWIKCTIFKTLFTC
jgi:hypothetical protein